MTKTMPEPIMRLRGEDLEDARQVVELAVLAVSDWLVACWEGEESGAEGLHVRDLVRFARLRPSVGPAGAPADEEHDHYGVLFLDGAAALADAARAAIRQAEEDARGYRIEAGKHTEHDARMVAFHEARMALGRRVLTSVGAR